MRGVAWLEDISADAARCDSVDLPEGQPAQPRELELDMIGGHVAIFGERFSMGQNGGASRRAEAGKSYPSVQIGAEVYDLPTIRKPTDRDRRVLANLADGWCRRSLEGVRRIGCFSADGHGVPMLNVSAAQIRRLPVHEIGGDDGTDAVLPALIRTHLTQLAFGITELKTGDYGHGLPEVVRHSGSAALAPPPPIADNDAQPVFARAKEGRDVVILNVEAAAVAGEARRQFFCAYALTVDEGFVDAVGGDGQQTVRRRVDCEGVGELIRGAVAGGWDLRLDRGDPLRVGEVDIWPGDDGGAQA